MDAQSILLTGATGLIGFQILLDALEAGFVVRAVIRSSQKEAKLLQNEHVKQAASSGQLSFTTITSFELPDAWDAALQGMDFVVHTASPLPLPHLDAENDIYRPITHGNASLLQAALRFPTIKRIVFTSTILATMPLPPRGQGPYTAKTRSVPTSGPFATVYDAYQAAKMRLLEQSHEITSTHLGAFDIINIFPGYTFGRNAGALKASDMFASSNGLLLALVKGRKFEAPRTAGAAHINDVSRLHIKALSRDVPGNTNYGVTVPITYDAAIPIAKARFPDAFSSGIFNENGTQPSEVVQWDARASEELFGMEFKDYEAMVTDLVGQYLEFVENEKGQR